MANLGIAQTQITGKISGGGSSAFSAITSGTNTTAAMIVGAGATFAWISANTLGTSSSVADILINTGTLFNTAIGNSSLATNSVVTGNFNTAIGYKALQHNTTGQFNTAVGVDALVLNTTGTNNTSIGTDSLSNSTTGTANTAIGGDSLRSNTTGGANIAIGVEALYSNTTGVDNTAIGNDALFTNVSGTDNTAIGLNALFLNTGSTNTAVGVGALQANTSGGDNTAIGVNALNANTTGGTNIAVGENALLSNTTGSNNTGLGYQANVNAGSYSNSTAIGANSTVTASNQIVFGNTSVTAIKLNGKVIQYDTQLATVSNGIPVEYATVDLTAQSAAIAATTIYAVPASGVGMYRISFYLKVTTAASTSSKLGGVTITFTDPTDSVSQSVVAQLADNTGMASTSDVGNTTTSVLQGSMIITAKASTNIQYAVAYASVGGTAMVYKISMKLEAM